MAYAKGLPATTVAVYTDRVIVRHPIHPTRHFKFDSIAQAKHWLQSLTVFKGCRQLPYAGDVTNVRYSFLFFFLSSHSFCYFFFSILIP